MILPEPPTFLRYARDSLEQALYALRENRLRTFLSVLGVAVGVAAVITVSTVSKSGREYVFSQLETFGLNNIWIWRNFQVDNPFRAMPQGSGISSDDLDAIVTSRCCPAVARFSPRVYFEPREIWIRTGAAYARTPVEGVGEAFLEMDRSPVSVGRGLRQDDMRERKPVAVIGSATRDRFFGPHSNPVGEFLRINDLRFTIVGVMQPKDRSFLMKIGAVNWDDNDRVFIPYTVYQQMLGSKDVHTLAAQAIDVASVPAATQQLMTFLDRRHNSRFRYVDDNMLRWVENANSYLWVISLIGVLGAAVSLLVGGIGIMNIMSTSVLERTREIGIRKAIGARDKDIMTQFLLESAFISSVGGLIGLLIGAGVSYGLAAWTGFPLLPSPLMVILALSVAMGVGVASGYYPAHRAAQLRPVEALRYE